MLGLRTIPLLALALIILTSVRCHSDSARPDKSAETGKSLYLRIKDLVKHVEENGNKKNVAQSTIAESPTERSSHHMKENGDQVMGKNMRSHRTTG